MKQYFKQFLTEPFYYIMFCVDADTPSIRDGDIKLHLSDKHARFLTQFVVANQLHRLPCKNILPHYTAKDALR